MPDSVTKDELTEVKMSLIKLEKDMEVMTSAVTKLAHTMETLAPVIVEITYMRKELDEVKKKLDAVMVDQSRDNFVTKAALTLASLAVGAGITVIANQFFIGAT